MRPGFSSAIKGQSGAGSDKMPRQSPRFTKGGPSVSSCQRRGRCAKKLICWAGSRWFGSSSPVYKNISVFAGPKSPLKLSPSRS